MRRILNKIRFKLLHMFFSKGYVSRYKAYNFNTNTNNYPNIGREVHLIPPIFGIIPENVVLESFTRIQPSVRFIMNNKQSVVVKKYSSIGANCMIVPGAHTPTIGLPQYLSYIGINDINSTFVINEDVWVGAGSTLLSKGGMGRGSVAAASSIVVKPVPPYAVVSGVPAKIIAVRFSLEQIIEHEKFLYPESERLSREILEDLFENKYKGLKVIGTSEISDEDLVILKETKKHLGIPSY